MDRVSLGDPAGFDIPTDVGGYQTPQTGVLRIGYSRGDSDAMYIDSAVFGPGIAFRRAGGTLSSPTDVSDGAQLGYLDFRGYSGDRYWQVGGIAWYVDGAVTSGQAPPSRMKLGVGNTDPHYFMEIDHNNYVYINGASQSPISGAAYLTIRSTKNDWTRVTYSSPSSGSGFGDRVHTVGETNSDVPLCISSGSGAGTGKVWFTGMGRIGIGNETPTCKVDINDDHIRVRTAKTPASATDTGNPGDMCWDANYVYVCTATNSWKRAALSTW